MAVAAILFSLWYAEIAKALELRPQSFREDNIATHSIVRSVFYSKALPVTIMACSVAIIFIPDTLKIIAESFQLYREIDSAKGATYDAVRTAYCFVTLLSSILGVYMCHLTYQLWKLISQLR
jgi:hypothetical protein